MGRAEGRSGALGPVTSRGTRGLLANASANTLVGVAGLAYAATVPAVVVRGYGPAAYGAWYLAFQISAYVLALDLGSQVIVSREAAAPSAGSDPAKVATAALVAQAGAAAVTLVLFAAVSAVARNGTLSVTLIVLGAAAAASLLASTMRAWFGGLRRSHVAAPWLVSARIAAVLGALTGAALDVSLLTVTVLVAAPQAMVHLAFLRWAHRPPSPWSRPGAGDLRRLVRWTSPLALWSVCGVLIGGVDIFIVNVFDPRELGPYAVALALIALPAGAVTAVATAWLPALAHLTALDRRTASLASAQATTAAAGVLALGCIPFVAMAPLVVGAWAGPGRWGVAVTSLQVLYVATALRYVFLPWVNAVVVSGEQHVVLLTPVVEASVNVAASVVGCLLLGAPGAAVGTLVGALAAAVMNVGRNMPAAPAAGIDRRGFLVAVRAAATPMALASLACLTSAVTGITPLSLAVGVVALAAGLLWAWRTLRFISPPPARTTDPQVGPLPGAPPLG